MRNLSYKEKEHKLFYVCMYVCITLKLGLLTHTYNLSSLGA